MRYGVLALAGLVAGALAGCSGGSTSTIPSTPIAQQPAAQQRSAPAQDPTLETPAPFATAKPTAKPTTAPTAKPTTAPTTKPTAAPTAKPTATPTPKPTATPIPVYPLKSGDTFSYQYSQSTVRTAGGVATLTGAFSGVVTSVLSGPANYNGASAFTLRSTGSASGGNASLDHSDYINLVSSGGHTEFVEYGYNYAATIVRGSSVIEHDSTILTYATPFVSDTLPESNGASWSEPVAITETVHNYDTTSQNSPNILSGQLVRATDGSYHASGMNYDVPETRLVRSNGTGEVVDGPASGATDWSYAIPVVKSGHEVIPATESYAGQSGTNFVPDWYPGGKLPASPLATASMRDLGTVKAPSQCGKRSGTSATHLQSLFSQLDPAIGFTNTEVRDDYVVAGMGYVCRLDAIVQSNYDNENTGKLTSTVKTNSAQVLVSETLK